MRESEKQKVNEMVFMDVIEHAPKSEPELLFFSLRRTEIFASASATAS